MTNRIPMYAKLKRYIYGLIAENYEKKQFKLPSENILCTTFGVSRITVKKALDDIESEGYIIRKKGAGTFINENADFSDIAEFKSASGEKPKGEIMKNKKTLGLILPDINSKYSLRIISGVQEAAIKAGWDVILSSTMYDKNLEETAIKKLLVYVDGIIVSPIDYSLYNKEILKLSLKNFPLVVLDNTMKGLDTDAVSSDNKNASFQATQYFLNRGKKRVGIITQPPQNVLTLLERLNGYKKALAAHGLPYCPELVMDSLENYDKNAIKKLNAYFDSAPRLDSLLAFNYETGISAIKAVMQRKDLGFTTDDIIIFDEEFEEIYDLLKIKINYIKQDAKKIGATAFKLILEQINDPLRLHKKLSVEAKFVLH